MEEMYCAVSKISDSGHLEIITCGATHGFLPNMQLNPNAVRAQIITAVNSYRKFLDRDPAGIWLPECGFYPGLEMILSEAKIRYFFAETHGILFADPKPQFGVFAPVYCKGAPVAAFGRDAESSRQVWSSQEGYPGDPAYRDFYRDIGFDLDMDYIVPYIDPIGIRINTGIKYYRITNKSADKLPYNRDDAMRVAAMHAGNFMFNRETGRIPLFNNGPSPYNCRPLRCRAFGHWWYEGPEWLNFLIRKIEFEQNNIQMITFRLPLFVSFKPGQAILSSWGEGGYLMSAA